MTNSRALTIEEFYNSLLDITIRCGYDGPFSCEIKKVRVKGGDEYLHYWCVAIEANICIVMQSSWETAFLLFEEGLRNVKLNLCPACGQSIN